MVIVLRVQWTTSYKNLSGWSQISVCWVPDLQCRPQGFGLDQLLLAEPAANRTLGSSRWVWLALQGREGSNKGSSGYRRKERGGKRGQQRVVYSEISGCWGRKEGGWIRHMAAWGLNFPAISTTPGLVLISQDTSPNPSPVLQCLEPSELHSVLKRMDKSQG